MIEASAFHAALREFGVTFHAGVPDSLLLSYCTYIEQSLESDSHVIAANEGSALALAAGNFFATGRIPLVYLQNSGLGNLVNPLLSLADKKVYSVPVVMLIGWRGHPEEDDEPQHRSQGIATTKLLEAMNVPWFEVGSGTLDYRRIVEEAILLARKSDAPVALLIRKGTFSDSADGLARTNIMGSDLKRIEALEIISQKIDAKSYCFSTTGMISRELFTIRKRRGMSTERDFLMVGSMGHVSQVALGFAIGRPDQHVVCLDGDGSILMHMGGLANVGQAGLHNFTHIVLNNGCHDSVGGQLTAAASSTSISAVAKSVGYSTVTSVVHNSIDLVNALDIMKESEGPRFMEVLVRPGSLPGVGRPSGTPKTKVRKLMASLEASFQDSQ